MNQTKASKMAVFANDWVLAGLKIRHFRGLTVPHSIKMTDPYVVYSFGNLQLHSFIVTGAAEPMQKWVRSL